MRNSKAAPAPTPTKPTPPAPTVVVAVTKRIMANLDKQREAIVRLRSAVNAALA